MFILIYNQSEVKPMGHIDPWSNYYLNNCFEPLKFHHQQLYLYINANFIPKTTVLKTSNKNLI